MFIEKLYLALETLKEEENKNVIPFLTAKQNPQAHLTNISLTDAVSDSTCFSSNVMFTKQNPGLNLVIQIKVCATGLFCFFLTGIMSHLVHIDVLFLIGINKLGTGT